MTRYSVQPRDRIFVKGYGLKKLSKTIAKNISKNLTRRCSWKFIDNAKQSATDTLKTASKRAIN